MGGKKKGSNQRHKTTAAAQPSSKARADKRRTQDVTNGKAVSEPRKLIRRVGVPVAFVLGALTTLAVDRFGPMLFDQVLTRAGDDLLNVDMTWPAGDPPCDYVSVAGIDQAPSPRSYRGTTDVIDWEYALQSTDVVPHRHATMLVTFAGNDQDSALIERIEPVVFESRELAPLWALNGNAPGCGGFSTREATLTLAGGTGFLVDEGERTELTAHPNEFGSYFTVSADDQTGIRMTVGVCDSRYYEFGLDVTYTLRGAEHHHLIGSEEDPFQIIGGVAAEYFFTSESPGTSQVTQVDQPEDEPVTFGIC